MIGDIIIKCVVDSTICPDISINKNVTMIINHCDQLVIFLTNLLIYLELLD